MTGAEFMQGTPLYLGMGRIFAGITMHSVAPVQRADQGGFQTRPYVRLAGAFFHTNEGWAEVEWSVVVMATGSWVSVEPLFYGATRSMTIWRSCHSIGKESLGPCAMA